ncbi:MAG TPA: HEAT repeat domain-containing protein [Acidimicrobiales bacterium]|nr:HEAT repeat domain-containing protein [Acidimicrobiales bacterium]
MRRVPAGSDFDGWVELLGVSTRRQAARRHLMGIGARAVPAIRRGVHHHDPVVRRACVSMLDQLVDDEAIPDLVGALDDDDPEVLRRALHALACDACKKNECHPGDELWVDRAVELARHEHIDVRAGAIDALAKAAGRRADVGDALLAIAERERDRGLSEMARRAAR